MCLPMKENNLLGQFSTIHILHLVMDSFLLLLLLSLAELWGMKLTWAVI